MARMPSISAIKSASAAGCGRLHALKRISAAPAIPPNRIASSRLREGGCRCVMDLIEFGAFRSAADDERCTLMNRLGLDIHDPGFAAGCLSSGLFSDKG